MHSRKARMNDGYYESQSRNFQNSKYNSSSRYSNYYRDREASPPKRIAHRSVSPEGSPRDGRDRYHQSSSYRNKDREREYKKDKYSDKRGRDRDIEYKNYNSKKAKTRDRSSSEDEHKEERLYDKRYSDRDSVRRPIEKERRFGDWKEMISKGSGKKYYYNERDKSSQWEKPEEWTEYEMQKEYPRGYRDKERERKGGRDDRYNSRRSYSSKHSRGNSRVRWPHESYPSTSSSMSHSRREGDNADMEISPDSTPTSEKSYASPSGNINSANIAEDPTATATSPNGHVPSKHHNNQSSTSGKQNSKQNSTAAASSSPSTHHNYHSSHHHRHRSVSPVDAVNDTNNSNSIRNSPAYGSNNNVTGSNNHLIGDGPPTPEMDLNSGGDHRRIDGVTGGVSSLQSVMSVSTVSNRLNLLTPSLAKFFRVDLLSHVTNWPSELLEKQAQKCAEDVYLLGDLECSRISAEIQCARSIVRVAEIAATIQGQRRLFLQEQIKEEQKPNAY